MIVPRQAFARCRINGSTSSALVLRAVPPRADCCYGIGIPVRLQNSTVIPVYFGGMVHITIGPVGHGHDPTAGLVLMIAQVWILRATPLQASMPARPSGR